MKSEAMVRECPGLAKQAHQQKLGLDATRESAFVCAIRQQCSKREASWREYNVTRLGLTLVPPAQPGGSWRALRTAS